MVRRFAVVGFAAMLALAACGGDDSSSGSSETTAKGSSTEKTEKTEKSSSSSGSDAIAKAKDCEQLVEAATPLFTTLFQGLVDDVQGMSVADLAKLQDPESSPVFQEWMTKVTDETKAIDTRSKKLKCSEEDGKKAVCNAVAEVKADNAIAEAMVKGMAGEC